jgi:predicted unusual protein kinase regulating ubiquinone biosynthesis (AarF/ABC1/UbiB family)
VANVATLLRLFGLIPAGLELQPLLDEARRQLHEEADYRLEADRLGRYRECIGDDPAFSLPEAVTEWVTGEVLPMRFVAGASIETLAAAEPGLRDAVASRLIGLALTEVLQWGLVQTDPNFANFRFDADSGRVGLLDFGAVREYPEPETAALRQLLSAAVANDRRAVLESAESVGYLADADPTGFRDAIADLVLTAAEPARHGGPYHFGHSDLARRMTEKVMQLRVEQRFSRLPPPSILFLHRKIAGTYLLCARLSARVDVGPLLAAAMVEPPGRTPAHAPERLRVAG